LPERVWPELFFKGRAKATDYVRRFITGFHLRQSLSKGENAFWAERFITCR
jgi:hypothetical protein